MFTKRSSSTSKIRWFDKSKHGNWLTFRKILEAKKDSHPDLLKYMLYYDLMVKLANTDTANLFNLTATLERLDEEEEIRTKIITKNPKLNSAKNLNDMLVDAYLLHFLGEMDPKMIEKRETYKKLMEKGKADEKEMQVDHMGKLQSMRELMKTKNEIDSQKSEEKINFLLGNLVKKRILEKKAQNFEMIKKMNSSPESKN